jgi:hypothetical protein
MAEVLIRHLKAAIYWENRNNFAQSIAGRAVAALPEGELKMQLQKRYGICTK